MFRSDGCPASDVMAPPSAAPESNSRRDSIGDSFAIWTSESGIWMPTRMPNSGLLTPNSIGAGQEDAQDERRDAKKAGADEEERVSVEERPAGCQALDHHPGAALGELADVGVRRTEKRVLRRRVAEAGQTGHIGDE